MHREGRISARPSSRPGVQNSSYGMRKAKDQTKDHSSMVSSSESCVWEMKLELGRPWVWG